MLKIRKIEEMTSNKQTANNNESSNVISHFLKFARNNKSGILIVFIFSIAYAIYIGYKYKPLYTSTGILDSKEVVKRDVMKEIVHDFFKYKEHLDIKTHQLRADTFKLGTRFYLDIYMFSSSTEKIESELLNYITSDSIIKNSINDKANSTLRIIKLINKQLLADTLNAKNGFIGNENTKLKLTEKLIEKQQLLVSLENYTPFQKSFGIPVVIEKTRINFIKNFFKCFISLIIVLLIFSNFKNKIS